MRNARGAFLSLALLFGPLAVQVWGDGPVLSPARLTRLAASPGWLRIGHWRKSADGSVASDLDDARWFLAPDGHDNPTSELAATIRGMFAAPTAPTDDNHVLCRYPARAALLTAALGVSSRLPDVQCPALGRFLHRVEPASVTYVFSGYYLNRPASAFGHTLLRLGRAGPGNAPKELLDVGVNYAALVGASGQVVDALRSLTGFARGEFGFLPYYFKVREYNDYDSRDLWEYELALDADRARLLALHLWELAPARPRYAFVNRNCSHQLLRAIEAIAPEIDLMHRVGAVVLPAETVRALDDAGLVRAARLRTSVGSEFALRAASLDAEERKSMLAVVANPAAAIPGTDAAVARVLDAALDWVDLSYADELMFGEQGNKADRLKQALASRRAALRVPSVPLDRSAAAAGDPRLGHPPARADAAFGRHASARFFEVSARLAQHDLGDPPAGYPELGEVRFLDAALRVREPWPTPRLQRFSFLDVKNLVPVTPFVRVLSWQGRIGVQRVFDARCRDCAAFAVELGTGATFADPRGRLAVWLLGASEILGHRLMRGIGDSPIRAALGPLAGLRVRLSARAVVLAEARALWAPAQVGPWTLAAQATLRVALGEHWAVDGRANVVDGAGEGSGALVIYF